jgi:starvation-inducible DNA-binding protein
LKHCRRPSRDKRLHDYYQRHQFSLLKELQNVFGGIAENLPPTSEHLPPLVRSKDEFKNNKLNMNYLGLDRKEVSKTVDQLNNLLSNYHVYYQNLRNFHWNVDGENFFDLHEQFEDLYDDAREKIDEIAERILTLRLRPVSTMSAYLNRASVEESEILEDEREMVNTVLENHRIIIENMRKVIRAADAVEDEGTIDMVGGFLAELEKASWMLDAWRAKKHESVTA